MLLSVQSQAPGSQAALAALCRIYWYPIYSFIRRRGHSSEDAQDLTQGFFLHLLDHKALSQVSPLRGKFRSLLRSADYESQRYARSSELTQLSVNVILLNRVLAYYGADTRKSVICWVLW